MMRLILIFVFVFWAVLTSQARNVSVVDSNADVKQYQSIIEAGKQLPPDSLERLFTEGGFLDASVVEENDSLIISTGVQYRLREVQVIGNDSLTYSVDMIFTKALLESHLHEILSQYQDSGYYYAALEVVSVSRNVGRVDIILSLNKGPLVHVGKIVFRGLERTRPETLNRFFEIGDREALTAELIERLNTQARSIPHLIYTGRHEIISHGGYKEADIAFEFKERQPVTIEAGGGYISSDRRFVWSADVQFVNLFGSGREARFFSERKEVGRNQLSVSYAQPTRLLKKGNIAFEASTRDYRDSFYEFKVSGTISGQVKRDLEAGLILHYRSIEPSELGSSSYSYTVGLKTDIVRLDYPDNPSRGFWLKTLLEFSSRSHQPDSTAVTQSLTETRAVADVGTILPLGRAAALKLRVNYHGLETPEELPPLSELVLVGGPGTLRGYRNEQFSALRMAVATVEPRIRFVSGYFFAFTDAAYLNNRDRDADGIVRNFDRFEVSYGTGLYLKDRGRSVKISLGWNPELTFDKPRISIELIADI